MSGVSASGGVRESGTGARLTGGPPAGGRSARRGAVGGDQQLRDARPELARRARETPGERPTARTRLVRTEHAPRHARPSRHRALTDREAAAARRARFPCDAPGAATTAGAPPRLERSILPGVPTGE